MENIGIIDRMIRFVIAIIFIVLGFTISPWWFIIAALALITALLGWCWLYALLGISTTGENSAQANKKSTRRKTAKRKKY